MSLEETRRIYDEAASGYDAEDRKGRLRRKLRFRIIESPIRRLLAAGDCLDLGCGTGRLLAEVGSASPNMGVDLSIGMLQQARRDVSALCVADAHHLPFADESFTSIVASNGVFRYLQAEQAFPECHRVLKRGGRLAVHQYSQRTSSISQWLKSEPPINPKHLSSLSDLTDPAEQAGFATMSAWLWRPVRFFPFVMPVPLGLPGNWWGHAVALFTKKDRVSPL